MKRYQMQKNSDLAYEKIPDAEKFRLGVWKGTRCKPITLERKATNADMHTRQVADDRRINISTQKEI